MKKDELLKVIESLEKENQDLRNQINELQEKNKRGAGRKKKISEETEEKIRYDYSFGSRMTQLAKKYNLSLGAIHKIINSDFL